jgi:hypothetical protein
MFFTFPEGARWNADRQAVEFGLRSGSTAASSGSRGACSSGYSWSGRPPERCVEAYYLHEPGSKALLSGAATAQLTANPKCPLWVEPHLPKRGREGPVTAYSVVFRSLKGVQIPLIHKPDSLFFGLRILCLTR